MNGRLLSCIKSILTDSSQRVRVGGELSGHRAVISGVPQGSVIGPILFVVFINDITNILSAEARAKLFADDLKSYVRLTNDNDIAQFTLMLEQLSNWSDAWQLPLAPAKCCWMKITNRREGAVGAFELNETELIKVNEIVDLGVLFASNLNFTNHISSIISKAKQRLFILRKSFVATERL